MNKTRHSNRLTEYFAECDGAHRMYVDAESRWQPQQRWPITDWMIDHAGDFLLVAMTVALVAGITMTNRGCKVTKVRPTTRMGAEG